MRCIVHVVQDKQDVKMCNNSQRMDDTRYE